MTKTVPCLIITLLLISLMTSGCIEIKDDPEGLTALEGIDLAEEVASNWSENAVLVYVGKSGSMVSGGVYSRWGYRYAASSNVSNSVEQIGIAVNADMTYTIREFEGTLHHHPIYNWNIDSDEAYETAKDNDQIQEFFSKYERTDVERFTLFGGEGDSDPTWKIHWSYSGGIFGDPVHAEIRINARTSEVIEVDADE
ncbi:MAG: hypothetical protein ACOC53_05635 [Candidatus Saliniplasma sp.]